MGFLGRLLSSDGLVPHGHCYLWQPGLVWLHVISDGLTALAYISIPFTLVYFARKRQDIPFNWMFLCFGLFIVACGATHVMEIWTLWTPVYWLSGAIKAVTALASVPTAILLVRLLPKALAVPTARQLSTAHAELHRAHEVLESRVLERTAELTRKNEELANEFIERKRVEDALRRSEGRFRRLTDTGLMGVLTCDTKGNILDANDVFLNIVGYTRDEVLSGTVRWVDMTPPEWRHLDERAIEQLAALGIAEAWEKEYLRKDGSRVPILVGVAMLDRTSGECIAFILDLTERKRAELAVRESEARKTAVMDVALDGIIVMDHAGNIVEFNRAAEAIFGYPRAEVVGKLLGDLVVPPALREQHRAGLARYVKTGEGSIVGKRIELSAIRSDGCEFPVEVAIVPIHTGGAPMFTGYIRDITGQKRASEALRVSEARFRRLTESGIIGIVLGDVDGGIHEANDAFLELVGYTRDDLLTGKIHGSKLNAPEGADAQATARQQLVAHGVSPPWEKEMIRKDGSRVPVLIGVMMLDTPNCLNIVLDLTEQKRAERAMRSLREQHDADARFRALLEAAPDAMVIVDRDGHVVLINIQAERLFGYLREELLGKSVDLLLPDRVHGPHPAGYFRDPSVRQVGSDFDLIARRKDGSEFPVEISLSPLVTTDGVLVSSAIRDITARKHAEQELRRAKDVAESASRELEAFSYSVAHDLRAPLRGINGYSVALLEDVGDKLDGEAKDYLERISAGAARMGHLIDALLGLSRVTRTEIAREQVNLTLMAQEIIKQLEASEPARSVECRLADGIVAHGDAQLLRVLMENLLGNAWKFVSKRAAARIEFGRDPDRSFFIRDNGAGFDMAYAQKLFAPFQRLHGSDEFVGTGIGLATVQRIVRRHGGRVWAEGALNRGATFRFTLDEAGAST